MSKSCNVGFPLQLHQGPNNIVRLGGNMPSGQEGMREWLLKCFQFILSLRKDRSTFFAEYLRCPHPLKYVLLSWQREGVGLNLKRRTACNLLFVSNGLVIDELTKDLLHVNRYCTLSPDVSEYSKLLCRCIANTHNVSNHITPCSEQCLLTVLLMKNIKLVCKMTDILWQSTRSLLSI